MAPKNTYNKERTGLPVRLAISASLAAIILAGCGGAGSSIPKSVTGPSGGGATINSGPIVMTSSVVVPPITIGGRNAVVTGFAGASFTAATAKLPSITTTSVNEALANTMVAFDQNGQTMLYNYGNGQLNAIGGVQHNGFSSDPSISGTGTRIANIQPVGPGYRGFVENLDGSSSVAITPLAGNVYAIAYSPDGSKIAFTQQDSSTFNSRIWTMPAGGGSATGISSAADNCTNPVWSPDGSQLMFSRQINASGTFSLAECTNSGANMTTVLGSLQSSSPVQACFVGNDPNDIVQTSVSSGTATFTRIEGGAQTKLFSTNSGIGGVTGSPVGKMILYSDQGSNGGIYAMDLDSSAPTAYKLIAGNGYLQSPCWGPYITSRTLIGAGGSFGASAGGFLYGAVNSRIGSMVAVDATTRSSISIQPQSNSNPTQSLILATVTATDMTSLKYMNGISSPVVTVFSGATTQATGALLSFDADTGSVVSVVSYTASLARPTKGGGVFTGKIIGAWDANGKNIAPSGATRVNFDVKSGRLISAG